MTPDRLAEIKERAETIRAELAKSREIERGRYRHVTVTVGEADELARDVLALLSTVEAQTRVVEAARRLVGDAGRVNEEVKAHVCTFCEHSPAATSEFCPCGCHHVWQRIYGDTTFPLVREVRKALTAACTAENKAATSE